MDGSSRSCTSINHDASRKSNRINYDSPPETNSDEDIFIVSPVPHSWTRIRSRKSQSPQKPRSPRGVVMQLDDFQWTRNNTVVDDKVTNDGARLSPRRSLAGRPPRYTTCAALSPRLSPEKQQRTRCLDDASSTSSPPKFPRPPLAMNSSSRDKKHRKSRSPPRRPNQDEGVGSLPICSMKRSSIRHQSREKGVQREERTRSTSRSRTEDRLRESSRNRNRSFSRDRVHKDRTPRKIRPESIQDRNKSRSRAERSSSRRRSPSHGRTRSPSHIRTRSRSHSCTSSPSRGHTRSRSNSLTMSRSHSGATRNHSQSRKHHSSGRTRSTSRSAKSSRRPRRGSASTATISSRETNVDSDQRADESRSVSPLVPVQLDRRTEESYLHEVDVPPSGSSTGNSVDPKWSIETEETKALIKLQRLFRVHLARRNYADIVV